MECNVVITLRIREQDPLKQGLKLPLQNLLDLSFIREQDPLKQGLKPTNQSFSVTHWHS